VTSFYVVTVCGRIKFTIAELIMLRAMSLTPDVYHDLMWLNAFPPKGGVSPLISPTSLISGVPLDVIQHCQLTFTAYAQTQDELVPTNSPNTRSAGAICLGPFGIQPSNDAEVVSDVDPAIPAAPSADGNDPLPDEFLQPHELFHDPQLVNLQDKPLQEVTAILPYVPQPFPDPPIMEEVVVNDTGLCCSTWARAHLSSFIPCFAGKSYKAVALLLVQLQSDHAFLSIETMTKSSSKAGPPKLGSGSLTAIIQELTQLDLHHISESMHLMNLLSALPRSAFESHLFLRDNCDACVKAPLVAGVNELRSSVDQVIPHHPTPVLEPVMLTAAIDAAEGQDVVIVDVPNASVQANLPQSSSKRTKHLNRCYSSISDHIIKGSKSIECCPATDVIVIILTKPLQGKLFVKFRMTIMHLPDQ